MASTVGRRSDRARDRETPERDHAAEDESGRLRPGELGADAEALCPVTAACHPRCDGGVNRAEYQCRPCGEPRVFEVCDEAETDPTEGETPPIPARQVDLIDYAKAAAINRVERSARRRGSLVVP